MGPLLVCLVIAGAITLCTWVASLITREYSWVDRIWSIAPIIYVWVFAAAGGFTPRLLLMAVLVTLWGIRLTFNFARKGGYRPGGEDYRWAVLRGRMSRPQFAVFNLLFISIFQNAVILAFTLPAFTVAEEGALPLHGWDIVIAACFLAFLVGETVADQQQWEFHRWKASERAAGRSPQPGFLQTGLFRFSRHPNFFFEQAQWWAFSAFAVAATGVLAALERRRSRAAHRAVHRLDDLHRGHLAVEVPRLRRVPGAHVAADPVVPASSRGDRRAHRLRAGQTWAASAGHDSANRGCRSSSTTRSTATQRSSMLSGSLTTGSNRSVTSATTVVYDQ